MHVRSYMAVRKNMFFEDPQVERILIEFQKVFLPLETHKDCMRIPFTVFIHDLSYNHGKGISINQYETSLMKLQITMNLMKVINEKEIH